MTVLALIDLIVPNIPSERLTPRRCGIDGLSLCVKKGDRVLIVGGAGSGKDTLYFAIRSRAEGVRVAEGYKIVDPLEDEPNGGALAADRILVVNGFRTRDQFRHDGQRYDPEAPHHWEVLKKAKESQSTFIALAEIDKIERDKIEDDKLEWFTRIVVIDEGRVVADSGLGGVAFKHDLERWIDAYALLRWQSLLDDCRRLRDRFGLQLQNSNWLKPTA